MKEKIIAFYKTHETEIVTVVLMLIVGTCMHFVPDLFGSEAVKRALSVVFPLNESPWEHMKLLWWPFLLAGILLSIKKKDRGYFGGFVLAGVLSILAMTGLFTFYQSITGVAVLAADISLYVLDVALCAMLGFRLAGLASLKNSFALWVVVAVFVTAGLIVLTYFPGKGYLFLDQRSGR